MTPATPRRITRSDPTRLEVEWDDGRVSAFTPAELRIACPCARCVDELSGRRILDPRTVAPDLQQVDVRLVGNYGLAIRFSDGHDTGIYPFRFLRERDEARDAAREDGT